MRDGKRGEKKNKRSEGNKKKECGRDKMFRNASISFFFFKQHRLRNILGKYGIYTEMEMEG